MERLKIQANFHIAPSEIMQVQRLLQTQIALLLTNEGRKKLKLLLAPILCKSEVEQQQFYAIYEEYLEKDLQLSLQEKATLKALNELESAQTEPQSWWEKWLPLVAGIVFALGIIGGLIYSWLNPVNPKIVFEKLKKEARVGDNLEIKNLTDTSQQIAFEWHYMNHAKNLEHTHNQPHFEWIIPNPGSNPIKKIQLHAHHPKTKEHLGTDSMEITILCNTLQVGAISVEGLIFRPNQPIQFSVETNNSVNLSYAWQFENNDSLIDEATPIYAFSAANNYSVEVTVTDTINTIGLCSKTVSTIIKIDPDLPDDPIALSKFDLLKEPPNIDYPLKPWYWPLLLLLMSAAAWCWWKWMNRPDPNDLAEKAEDLALKNRFATSDRKPYSIPFAPIDHQIQADKDQFGIAHILRNRQRGNRKIMDVSATLTATIEKGGFPSLQYRYTTKPTDYLVLIDWQSANSHLARLFQYLANMLQEQDVLLEIFYYQNDFQKVWNQRHLKGINLAQLHRLYPQQRLLVFGAAHSLAQQTSDQTLLQPIWERQLRKWPDRLLLTPIPIISWTYLEARLYRLFALFPADLGGIIQAVRYLESGATEEDLPSTLNGWETRLQRSQIEENIHRKWRTLAHHEQYLEGHPEVLRWLKALVVYPQPTWNVTIAIGKALGVPVTYDNLMLLARIPWMQDGDFKPRLWRSIWAELPKKEELIARNAVKAELETVRKQTVNAFAKQQLEKELVVQNFALAPTNLEHQKTIQYLRNNGQLPAIHVEELDKVVERHIPKHRIGNKTGQTLTYYLEDKQLERNRQLKRPIGTTHFWWALALSLLSLLLTIGLFINGDYPHRNSLEQEKNEAARLNNLAVDYMASNYPLNLDSLTFTHSLPIQGFNYKSTTTLNILSQAVRSDTTFEKAHHNLQKQWYHDGLSHYEQYLKDKKYDVQPAKQYFKQAINYSGINNDAVYYAAAYALANVHHILGEQDSVCTFLGTLLKIADVPFFDSIPNLSSQARYCQNKEMNLPNIAQVQGVVLERISRNRVSDVEVSYFNLKTQTDEFGRYNFSINPNFIANFINRGGNTYSGEIKLSFSKNGYKTVNRYFSVALTDSIANVIDNAFFEKSSSPVNDIPEQIAQQSIAPSLQPIIDLSPYCPTVGNSGTISSTVGWSLGYYAMTIENAIRQGWTNKKQITDNAFSPLFIYNQINGGNCNNGAKIEDALDLVKEKGVCLLKSFQPADCKVQPKSSILGEAANYKISSYHRIWSRADIKADKIRPTRAALQQNKPVIIGFSVIKSFLELTPNAKYWIQNSYFLRFLNKKMLENEEGSKGTTSLTVVGYSEDAFKVVNHWGEKWGDQGYIWIKNDDFEKFALSGYVIELGEGFGQSPTATAPDTATATIETGTFTDLRDKQTYKWVRLKDGKKWMAQNLNFNTTDSTLNNENEIGKVRQNLNDNKPDSWCYDNNPTNCEKYGRLYTWQSAKNACPKGWHLPSDDEWWNMASFYGKAYNEQEGQEKNDARNAGGTAYQTLIQGGNSGFSALLGGGRRTNGFFAELGYDGQYWSHTEKSSLEAWYYLFNSYDKTLARFFEVKSNGRSCRCLQDLPAAGK